MNLATIVSVKAGHTVPRAYLELVLKNCNVAGFAIQEDGKLTTDQNDVPPNIDDVLSLDEESKDCNRTYYFGNFGEGFNSDDVQPFVMRVGEDDSEDILAIFAEGDFPGYTQENGRSDEYNLMEEIILPTLMQSYEHCEGDLDKFFAGLDNKLFKKNLLNTGSHRCVFQFVPSSGDPVAIGNNDLGGEFEWGAVSQLHGYSEGKAAPAAPAKKGWWNRGSKATSTPAPKKEEEAKPDAAPDPKKTETAPVVPIKTADEYEEISPPPTLHGKPKKAWIRRQLGLSANDKLPAGWKEPNFKIRVKKRAVVHSLQDLDKLGAVNTEAANDKPAATAKAGAPRTQINKPQGNKLKAAADAATQIMPILSAEERKEVDDYLTKYLNGSEVTNNPLEIQKEEQKYPYWSEATGRPFEEILSMPISLLFALAEMKPKAVVLMLIEARRKWVEASGTKLEDLVNTDVEETEEDAEAPVETVVEQVKNVVKSGAKKLTFNRQQRKAS